MFLGSQALSGLDVVLRSPELIPHRRPGLLTTSAAVTADFGRGVDALVGAGLRPHCLLAPEHGYWSTGQAGEGGEDDRDPVTGVPVVSTYRVDGEDLERRLGTTGIDAVVVDLPDIGCRFYTYLWSMFDAMRACASLGLPVIVLDRPAVLAAGPLGPGLDPRCSSFVGRVDVPLRHGARLGALARHLARHHLEQELDLTVIEAPGADGAPVFVPASPNMPTRETVALYPGMGLLEGTTWCEGRGTTLPFSLFGAPWAGPELAGSLREQHLPGIGVRETVFVPAHGAFAGQRVHGAQIHVLPGEELDPLRLGHAVLSSMRAQHPDRELWRKNRQDGPHFVDLLWGSSALREGIDDRADLEQILAASPPAPLIDGASALGEPPGTAQGPERAEGPA